MAHTTQQLREMHEDARGQGAEELHSVIEVALETVEELESQLKQASTGRAISMTVQLRTRKVAHSIGCLTVMLEQLPDEVKQGLSPEVAGVIQEWLADQFETVDSSDGDK